MLQDKKKTCCCENKLKLRTHYIKGFSPTSHFTISYTLNKGFIELFGRRGDTWELGDLCQRMGFSILYFAMIKLVEVGFTYRIAK